jgi:L-malate glycosyltransferase
MKKIIFVTDKVYPYFFGGQEKRIHDFARKLAENGFDVSIASMKWWKEDNFIKDGIKYIAFSKKIELYKKDGRRNYLNNFLFGLNTFFFVLKTDSDIIDFEVFPYFPIIFARLAIFFGEKKTKIIGNWCECLGKDGWKNYDSNRWFIGLVLEKLAKSSCDKYLAISEFTKNRMVKNLGIDEKKIEVIHPCIIDYERIYKIKEQERKDYDIVFFGRLVWHKHVEKIIEISNKLKKNGINAKILIIGNGPEEENIKRIVEEHELMRDVYFLDFIDSYDELIKKIKSAKIMILPSEREGFGIAVLEANACGLPVLVLDYPDNAAKELIKNGENGFVCKNDKELYEKTKFFLEKNVQVNFNSSLPNSKKMSNFYNSI